MNARPLGAAGIGGAGVMLLHAGAVPWPAAVLGGVAAAIFTLQRTTAGSITGYAMVLAAAVSVFRADPARFLPVAMLLALAGLEVYGLGTVAIAARASTPPRVSRRLLGAWLASSGALVFGLALCAGTVAASAGSVLVAGGLAYKLGVVPAFAWAPLLIRHTAPRVAALGALALLVTLALLAWVMPYLPDPAAAGTALNVLSVATIPWALWHLLRQWRSDRRCARSYGAVLAAAGALMLLVLTSHHLTLGPHLR